MERREHPRLDIELRCLVWRPQQQGTPLEVVLCNIHNIGRGGMLIEWRGMDEGASPPMLDEKLDIEVVLPVSHGFGPRCIYCRGKVLRISPQDGRGAYIAVQTKEMKFRPLVSAFEAARRDASSGSMPGVVA